MNRCSWCMKDELYRTYHDTEWGVPVFDDRLFFEHLVMEVSQAGLSFYTILQKREHYRAVLDDFDYEKIALYNPDYIEALMQDDGLIRNRKKLESIVHNAQIFMQIQKQHGSFSNYIWAFTEGQQIVNHYETEKEIPAVTELSTRVSKQMKKDGFKFIGPTSMYAFLQATGIINDHIVSCHRYHEVMLEK
ncbi:MAG: DNA-3-methyladenine glycosylase I [Clostridia bacterium]|nr:DNA-3-methyladenine glycosylase I [Clostridia bacterium]